MAKEIDFENGRIANFQRHVTFTLDRAVWAMWYTVVHHSSTSTYIPNLIKKFFIVHAAVKSLCQGLC